MNVYGIGGHVWGVVDLAISPNDKRILSMSAILLPRFIMYASVTGVTVGDWLHLQSLDLADPNFLEADLDLFLGADVYAIILGPRRLAGGDRVRNLPGLDRLGHHRITCVTHHRKQCIIEEFLGSLLSLTEILRTGGSAIYVCTTVP